MPRQGLPWWVFAVAGGLLLAGASFFVWLGKLNGSKAFWWGMMGDSVAPFTALFSAAALGAALWTLHEQRAESESARRANRHQLRMMSGQLTALTRTAKAQQRLAKSQSALAGAQLRANVEAAELRLAQHANTIALMDSALATMAAAELSVGPWPPRPAAEAVAQRRQAIGFRIDHELRAEHELAVDLGKITWSDLVAGRPSTSEDRKLAPELDKVRAYAEKRAASYVEKRHGLRDIEEREVQHVLTMLDEDWRSIGGDLERLGVPLAEARNAYVAEFFRALRRIGPRRHM